MQTIADGIVGIAARTAKKLRPAYPDPGEVAPAIEQDVLQAEIAAFLATEIGRLLLATPPRFTVVPSRRIVNGREQVRAGPSSAQLVGFQPGRQRIWLRNDSNVTVYLGSDLEAADDDQGFEIGAGEQITLETQAAIWLRTAADETAVVQYLIEYGD